ncbi:MAG TPA: TonB-dependent receptor [Bryobacteraceae bacterium]|nr:TonB-dependent receptor [Bryobacteraceae bacterium]
MKQFTRWSTFFAALWLAYGQMDSARITGTVTDVSGAVLPNAGITVKNGKTGEQRTVHSNDSGYYMVTNLAPASYSVSAKAEGLGPAEYSEIRLIVGQERTLNLILQPAGLAQEVTVSGGELTTIDTSSARMGANVNEREVANLPLNGRQVSQLYLLAPGAQTSGGGSFDNIRFSGRANQQNEIRVDGVEATSILDASPGNLNGETSSGFRLQSSLETIQEFRVESSNYPAEFGTGTGGQISVVTKSGGNDFHGALFEYLRNDALDARNFFDGATKSPLRLNQFGGSLGGPIRRNKMFFFLNYEGLRQTAGINLIATVPSLAARARAVPSIASVVNAFPMGLRPTSNPDLDVAQLNTASRLTENYGNIRFDYRFNDKFTMYARYYRDQGISDSPIEGTSVSGSRFQVTAVPQNGLIDLTQVLAPTVINETKFGFNGAKTRASGFAPSIPGVPDASAISVDFTGNATIPGIGGQISSAGAARLGGLVRSNSTQNGRGQPYTNYSLSFVDSLSWLKGNHNYKFGGELRPLRIYTDRLGGTTYTFANLNDLLANNPTQTSFLGDVSAPSPFNGGATGNREAKQYYAIGYAQDEWKIRPNLTMSYGLRYEYYSVLHEARNLAVIVDAATGQFRDPKTTDFYRSSKLNFGPRLAFTWSPERLGNKTVFRVGAGYYFGPGQTEDQVQPIESDRVSKVLTGGSAVFPIDPARVIAAYDINDPNLGYQPRVYMNNAYTLPEKILSYTASLQQELPGKAILTVAYVGSQGRNLFLRGWTNRIVGVGMNPTTGAAIPTLQFGNRFSQMDFKTSGGTDHYDSMQTTLNRRFNSGLTFGSQWTWSHSIGNTGGSNEANTTQDPTNFGLDRGNNNFDVRHSWNASALYELPYGAGRKFGNNANPMVKSILGGWQLGQVWNFNTGLPLEVRVTRPDIVYRDSRNGTYVASPIVANGAPVTVPVINVPGGGNFRNFRRADYIGGNPFLQTGDRRYFLNPAAFAIPAPGEFGNLGRNVLHGPILSQFDLTVQKQFPIRERMHVEFRAEIYNLFNRANFANAPAQLNQALGTGMNQLQPGQPFTASAAGGAFGVFNSTVEKAVGLGAARQIQLSLRLTF